MSYYKQILPSDVIGPDKRGRKVAILVDSCDSRHVAALVQGADVIVHEATLGNDMTENAIEKGHSTPGLRALYISYTVKPLYYEAV